MKHEAPHPAWAAELRQPGGLVFRPPRSSILSLLFLGVGMTVVGGSRTLMQLRSGAEWGFSDFVSVATLVLGVSEHFPR